MLDKDEDAGQLDEAQIDVQPGKEPFDLPAAAVAAKLATILFGALRVPPLPFRGDDLRAELFSAKPRSRGSPS